MAFRTDTSNGRHLISQKLKNPPLDPNQRDRPVSKFRIKSELRGTFKMPPIIPQTSTSAQLNKNPLFNTSKTPTRKPYEPRSLMNDESSTLDTGSYSSNVLSGDLSIIPKTTTAANQRTTVGLGPLNNVETPLNAFGQMIAKSIAASPLSSNILFSKTPVGLKSKMFFHKKPAGLKKSMIEQDTSTAKKNETPVNSENVNMNDSDRSSPAKILPKLEPTRCSSKKSGVVKAYAANTNQGLFRNYNEDRVAIILNIMKPQNVEYTVEWPACSFFAIYDGHGGTECADFLRDNLHQLVIRDQNFPFNPVEALKNGFEEAERQFTEIAQNQQYGINRSGSCAIVALIIDDTCYVANVGDSRTIMSCQKGAKAIPLSRDHKPDDENETERIVSCGGKIYQTQIPQPMRGQLSGTGFNKPIFGPHRVFPGRLSVSRTFGDIEAKITKYGGIPGVVVAEPEIKSFKLTKESDFIVLGCDGIFDKLSDADVVKCVWDATKSRCNDLHSYSSLGVEYVLNESMTRKSMDNVTVVMVTLEGFESAVFSSSEKPNEKASRGQPHIQKKSLDFEVARDNREKVESVQLENSQLSMEINRNHISGTMKKREAQRGEFSQLFGDRGEGTDQMRRSKGMLRKFK